MKSYLVSLDQHELRAMRDLVMYGRAIAQTLPDKEGDTFALRMKIHAQTIEDIIERVEKENPEFSFG